jgi:galactokinase
MRNAISPLREDAITAQFRSLYGTGPTCWVRAPGRAELLGTDTDDHLGYVLTMGIHLDTWIAFKPSGTDTVRVHSMNLKKDIQYAIGSEPDEPAGTWDRYISGVSRALRLRGYPCSGVDAVLHSTLPIGGGLSSSASLEVATALMFQVITPFSISKLEIAEACQQAENQSAGVRCGILDQYSSVFAKEGTAMLLDCLSLSHVEVGIPKDIKIVICDTNFPRTLAGSEYAKRRLECDEGTRLLREQDSRIRTLRDVNDPMFDRLKSKLPETLQKRCQFVFQENQRVVDFMAAIVKDDREAMKALCSASFIGERDLYEKTVPAMERMHEAMMSGPGIVAARQSGGGFGGCMLAYVLEDQVEAFAAHIHKKYCAETQIQPAVYVTAPSSGACIFEPVGQPG